MACPRTEWAFPLVAMVKRVGKKSLWVMMPFMDEDLCLHLMKIAYANGFEEEAIESIFKELLKALPYLHQQGHIH
ncbi:Serine/threonine-protein kinase fray2 [Spatholobus suberectus]|nr:Serine/threonine-protein kinase fray2 [Spatholobus suberectus]